MMYYTTVSGWMVDYFAEFIKGTFVSGMASDAVSGVFDGTSFQSRKNGILDRSGCCCRIYRLQLWFAERT